jgi:hypothetical protein
MLVNVLHCGFQIADFPFDNQHCFMQYGSWSLTADEAAIGPLVPVTHNEYQEHDGLIVVFW